MNTSSPIRAVCKILRQVREEQHLDQCQAAYRADISRTHLCEIEWCATDIKLSTFLKLCRCYRIAPWKVLFFALYTCNDFEDGK